MAGTSEESAGATAIRPFTVAIPEAEIETLRARVAASRWPSKELVSDRSQGVQLATIQELARYWATDYDWRACAARRRRRSATASPGMSTRKGRISVSLDISQPPRIG